MPFMPVGYLLYRDHESENLDEHLSNHSCDVSDLTRSLSHLLVTPTGSTINGLPDEVLGIIVDHLASSDRARLALVNKGIRQLIFSHLESKAQALSESDELKIIKAIYPYQSDLWSTKKQWMEFVVFRKRLWDEFMHRVLLKCINNIYDKSRETPPWISLAAHPVTRVTTLLSACPEHLLWCEIGTHLIQALSWPNTERATRIHFSTLPAASVLIVRFTVLFHEELQLQLWRLDRINEGKTPTVGNYDLESSIIHRQVRLTAFESYCLSTGFMAPHGPEQWAAFSYHIRQVSAGLIAPRISRTEDERRNLLARTHGAVVLPTPIPAASLTSMRSHPTEKPYFPSARPIYGLSGIFNKRLQEELGSKGEYLTALSAYQFLEGLGAREEVISSATKDMAERVR